MRTIQHCFMTLITNQYQIKKNTNGCVPTKLSLNVVKTKFMYFHKAQRIVAYPELKVKHLTIDKVTEFNLLRLQDIESPKTPDIQVF